MSQRRLHLGERGTTIKGMGAVRVAEPMGTDVLEDIRFLGGALDHTIDGTFAEITPVASREYWRFSFGCHPEGLE
jgi:hypothetical protein